MPITPSNIRRGGRVFLAHINFGPAGHGYRYRNRTFPRLEMYIRKYKGKARERAGKRTEVALQVDGQPVADLAEALARLNEERV